MVNFIPSRSRSAEKVASPSLNFPSVIFDSILSGQAMVPVSLSPSRLSVRVDGRFCPLMSVSHFQVPLGSAFLSSAAAKPTSPSANAAVRTAFMATPSGCGRRGLSDGDGYPRPLPTIIGTAPLYSRLLLPVRLLPEFSRIPFPNRFSIPASITSLYPFRSGGWIRRRVTVAGVVGRQLNAGPAPGREGWDAVKGSGGRPRGGHLPAAPRALAPTQSEAMHGRRSLPPGALSPGCISDIGS